MARTPAFKVKSVSGLPEWAGFADLALKCQDVGLSSHQAQCALLWCRGLSYGEIGRSLEIEWQSAQRAVRQAAISIGAICPEMYDVNCDNGLEMWKAFRNFRTSGPRPSQIYPMWPRPALAGHCGSYGGVGRLPLEECLRWWVTSGVAVCA